MPVTINGSTGIGTPGVASTGAVSGTTGTFTGNVSGADGAFSGNVTANGLSTELRPLVSGTAQASTSGTVIDFTDIPSWVTRITVMLDSVSLSSTGSFLVQLGTAGGPVATGYTSGSWQGSPNTSTTGFVVTFGVAGTAYNGLVTITKTSGSVWTSCHTVFGTSLSVGAGRVDAGGVVTQLRCTNTATGTNTFDAGTINVMYE